jgi:SAM-dependent methyltransferase
MKFKTHWDQVYTSKDAGEVSWYRPHLEKSLELIRSTGVSKLARIIDVGGGASTLVDDLLADGYQNLTVLDISSAALETAKQRLGERAKNIAWRVADITSAKLPLHYYDVWHDRAVFHFLTNENDRRRYVELVQHAVKPNGHIIVASFGPNGPLQCSGLDICRYSPDKLHGEFGPSFQLVKSFQEEHFTPIGKEQQFIYCYCRKM